jgi:hypothetical protein
MSRIFFKNKFYLEKEGIMACITKRRNRWIKDFYDNQGKRRWKTFLQLV